ncbi:MAG: TonB-dependent receptor [Solimonas sp.]
MVSAIRKKQVSFAVLGGGFLLAAAQAAAQATAQTTPADSQQIADAATAADSPAPAPGPGPVPDDIETVTVTSRDRSLLAAKQDVPASVSVISGETLSVVGADSLRDITRRAANISRQNTSNARSQGLVIRGIGRRGSTEAQDPTVGITIDGIPYLYPGLAAWDWVDVDTVEVARGPQGTEGGGYASFGNLTLNSKRPSFTPSTDWSLRVGQRDGLFGTAAIGGPLIDDKLAWRGTFYVDKQEGYYKNTYWDDDQTYTDRLKISGKVQFLYKPIDNYTVYLSADLEPKTYENDNGLNFFHSTPATYTDGVAVTALDAKSRLARRWFGQLTTYNWADDYLNYNSGTQNSDAQLPLLTGTRGVGLTQTWAFNDASTLTSITGFRDLHFDARNDEGTPFDISTQGGGGVRFKQLTQELRVNSQLGNLADLTAGAFYAHHTYEVDSKTGWGDDAGAWFASNAQYTALDTDGDGRYLLQESLTGLRTFGQAWIDNHSTSIFGNIKWNITDRVKLTTGVRVAFEDRKGSSFKIIESNGYGGGLNASVSSSGQTLGGFDSFYNTGSSSVWKLNGYTVDEGTAGAVEVASGDVALTTDTTNTALLASAQTAADAAALKYFNVSTWSGLSDTQKEQLAYAQLLRKAQTGLLYSRLWGESYKKQRYVWVFSPSFEFNDTATGYFSYQHGEKPGIVQVINAASMLVDGESGNHFELGLKTNFREQGLLLNVDVFYSRLKNYQQTSAVYDEVTTELNGDGNPVYVSTAANVPSIEVYGLELDSTYNAIPYTTIALSAAYNVAKYLDFPNSPTPSEIDPSADDYSAYRDISGKILPGAAKYTGNLSVDFRHPLPWLAGYDFFTDLNANYTSRYNSDITLSQYSWIHDYTIVDAGIGISRQDGGFSVSVVGKNLSNAEGKAYGWQSGTLDTTPRWFGVIFAGRL